MTEVQVFDGDGTRGMLVYDVQCQSWVQAMGPTNRRIDFWWFAPDPAERNVYLRTFRSAIGNDVKLNVTWPEVVEGEDRMCQTALDISIVEVSESVRHRGDDTHYGLVLHAQKQWWP